MDWLVSLGLKAAGRAIKRLWRTVTPTGEEKAFGHALLHAVQRALAEMELPDSDRLQQILDRGAAAEALAAVVQAPTEPADLDILRAEVERGGYTIDPTRIIEFEQLIHRIRDLFLTELVRHKDGRGAQLSARVEQNHTLLHETRDEARQIGSQLGDLIRALPPDEAPGILAIIGDAYEAARKLIREGNQVEGARQLEFALRQLDELGSRGRSPLGTPLRQRILLSQAQLAVRSDDDVAAERLLHAARELGEFTGARRDIAGWVLLNLGHHDEAHRVLSKEFNGSEDWARLRAVAALSVGNYADFALMVGPESSVTDTNILGSLVHYYTEQRAFRRAADAASRMFGSVTDDSGTRLAAATAGAALVAGYARADDPEQIDISPMIDATRDLLTDAASRTDTMTPWEQRLFANSGVQFHHVLMEREQAGAAFAELLRLRPSSAARVLAAAPGVIDGEGFASLAPLADTDAARAVLAANGALAVDDQAEAARLLSEALPTTDGSEHDRILATLLEVRGGQGEDLNQLLDEADNIQQRSVRAIARAALRANRQDGAGALMELERGMLENPRNIELLRTLTDLALQVARHGARETKGTAVQIARTSGKLLVARLPCPEHKLLLARALVAADAPDEALHVVTEVEAGGYITQITVGLVAELTGTLGYVSEHAAAARRFHMEYGHAPKSALAAANAAYVARDYAAAAQLYAEATAGNDPETAVQGYINWAHTADAAARASGGARGEMGLEILRRGYETLHAPQLAGALLARALNTAGEADTVAVIARDFGSAAALPGWHMVSIDEFVNMNEASNQRYQYADKYWRAGVLPFETFCKVVNRSAPFVWTALHDVPQYIITEPPPLLPRDLSALIDNVPEGVAPPPTRVLLDDTALLTLETIGLLDRVLEAPSMYGKLLLEEQTHRALKGSVVSSVAPGDIERRKRALRVGAAVAEARSIGHEAGNDADSDTMPAIGSRQRQATAVESRHASDRQSPMAAVVSAVPDEASRSDVADDDQVAEELKADLAERLQIANDAGALVVQDAFDDGPSGSRSVISSAEVALALLRNGAMDVRQLADAHAAASGRFPTTLIGVRDVSDTHRPLLVDISTLTVWELAGLLPSLRQWPGGLAMIASERAFVLHQTVLHQTEDDASQLAEMIFQKVTQAIEYGALRLASVPVGMSGRYEIGDKPTVDATSTSRDVTNAPSVIESAANQSIEVVLRVLERRMATAEAHGAVVWSDDAAIHLCVEHGPYLSAIPELWAATERLRQAYPIRPSSTSAMLRRLEAAGDLTSTEGAEARRMLVRAKHWFTLDADDLVHAALASDDSVDAIEILAYLGRSIGALPPEAAFRSAPAVAATLAQAMVGVGSATVPFPDAIRAATRLVQAVEPWFGEPSIPTLLVPTLFWRFLNIRMAGSTSPGPGMIVHLVLAATAARWPQSRPLADALPVFLGMLTDMPLNMGAVAFNRAMFDGLRRSASEVVRPDGRPWLPPRVLRLTATALGVVLRIEERRSGTLQTPDGPKAVTYVIREAEAVRIALSRIQTWLELSTKNEETVPDSSGLEQSWTAVEMEVPAEESELPAQSYTYRLDPLDLLLDATPAQGQVIAEVLAQSQDNDGAPELAALTNDALAELRTDPEDATRTIAEYARSLLAAPRTWMPENTVECVRRLRDVSLTQLHVMTGGLPHWNIGETGYSYAARIAQDGAMSPAREGAVRSLLLWGGRDAISIAAARAQVAQINGGAMNPLDGESGNLESVDEEGVMQSNALDARYTPEQPEPHGRSAHSYTGQRINHVSELIALALRQADPYERATNLLGAIMAVTMDGELQSALFSTADLPRPLARTFAVLDGVGLAEVIGVLLARYLKPHVENGNRVQLEHTAEPAQAWQKRVSDLVHAARGYDVLHAEVARVVFRAIFTRERVGQSHAEANARLNAERPQTNAGDERPAEDPDGTLLATFVALVSPVFDGAVETVRDGPELDRLSATLAQLSEGREFADVIAPQTELLQPDAMGPGKQRADPYQACLLRGIAALLQATGDSAIYDWAVPELMEALLALSSVAPTEGERFLAGLSAEPGHDDRFLSCLEEPLAVQALAIHATLVARLTAEHHVPSGNEGTGAEQTADHRE